MSFLDLITLKSAAAVANAGLAVAQGLGLPVSTWRVGDPTKSLYSFVARMIAGVDGTDEGGLQAIVVEYTRAAVLSSARGKWLKVVALEVYGVSAIEATFATATVTLHNTGGGFYPIAPRDLTFKSSASNKTYHNTNGGTLSAGVTLTFDVEADEAGSDSNAIANEIDTLVTTRNLVVVVSSTVAVATDEESEPSIRDRCAASRGALSPNGPADAYNYVVLNPTLTGVTDITQAKSLDNNATLNVTIYVASPSGAPAGASVIAAQAAVERWATPLCVRPTVIAAAPVAVPVTATVHGDLPGDFSTTISEALTAYVSGLGIGGIDGLVPYSQLIATIQNCFPLAEVIMSVPSSPGQVVSSVAKPVPGTFAITQV
jgi:hypothetical protein